MNISYSEINEKCLKCIDVSFEMSDIDAYLYFALLYSSGLRASECINVSAWLRLANGDWLVPGHKKGNPKILGENRLPSLLIDFLDENPEFRFLGSISTYQRLFVERSGLHQSYVGQKRMLLHTFRHLYIKRRAVEGASLQDISTEIGNKKNTITMGYINKIYQSEKYDAANSLSFFQF